MPNPFNFNFNLDLNMNMSNLLRTRCCSFCGNSEHEIRQCNSSAIVVLDRRLTEGFYSIWQQGTSLQMDETLIKERFVIWTMNSFHLRDLKVIAVTTTDVPASGRNKREYADDIWQVYRILLTRVLSLADVGNIVNQGVLNETININEIELDAETDDFAEITWTIDREGSSSMSMPMPMPSRHHDIEMMSLPNIRTLRSNRIRESRLRDIYSYTPNPEFITFIRNLLITDMDTATATANATATGTTSDDFIPFNSVDKKYNINVQLSTEFVDKAKAGSCCICMNDEINCDNMVTLNCQHQFCSECVVSIFSKHNKGCESGPCCSLCRCEMKQIHVNDVDVLAQLEHFCSM
jgi:hypothetical protein